MFRKRPSDKSRFASLEIKLLATVIYSQVVFARASTMTWIAFWTNSGFIRYREMLGFRGFILRLWHPIFFVDKSSQVKLKVDAGLSGTTGNSSASAKPNFTAFPSLPPISVIVQVSDSRRGRKAYRFRCREALPVLNRLLPSLHSDRQSSQIVNPVKSSIKSVTVRFVRSDCSCG